MLAKSREEKKIKTYGEAEAVKVILGDDNGESSVGTNPGGTQMGTERLVRILEGLLVLLLWWDIWGKSTLHSSLECTVNISLGQIRLLNDVVLSV